MTGAHADATPFSTVARAAGQLLAVVLGAIAATATMLVLLGLADAAERVAMPEAAIAALVALVTGTGGPDAVTVTFGEQLPAEAIIQIVQRNAVVAMFPILAVLMLDARRTRRRRRVLDLVLILFAVRQLWTLVVLLAAHPEQMTRHVAAYLPIELAAFAIPAAAYLLARRGRRLDLMQVLGASLALVLLGAVVETLTAGRLG